MDRRREIMLIGREGGRKGVKRKVEGNKGDRMRKGKWVVEGVERSSREEEDK